MQTRRNPPPTESALIIQPNPEEEFVDSKRPWRGIVDHHACVIYRRCFGECAHSTSRMKSIWEAKMPCQVGDRCRSMAVCSSHRR